MGEGRNRIVKAVRCVTRSETNSTKGWDRACRFVGLWGAKKMRSYHCEMCKDRGTIHRGFLWWKVECPVCKGDPIGKFRKDHPAPHMPPPPPDVKKHKPLSTGVIPKRKN